MTHSFFQSDIMYFKGVGPKRAEAFAKAGIRTTEDLLNFFPRRYLDRSTIKSIAALREGEIATVVGEVRLVQTHGTDWKNKRLVITFQDKTGKMDLVWFQGAQYLQKNFRAGDTMAVSGKVGFFGSKPQIMHPDYDKLSGKENEEDTDDAFNEYELFNTGKVIPLYPSSDAMKRAYLTSRVIRKVMRGFIEQAVSHIQENLPASILAEENLMALAEAYREIHFPSSPQKLNEATYRLKWTELFYMQLLFALRKESVKERVAAPKFETIGENTHKLFAALPYEMTNAQKRVIKEIRADVKSGTQMNRLVQGDVGSGKTVVATFSMMMALDNQTQAAFMAPTEILATQHFLNLKKMLTPLGITVTLLVGKQRKKLREEILTGIASGDTHITVGTHALIEDKVEFKNLGLVVIDEQHRFGVLQRKALQDKSSNPHILLMTATPIPRTLTMTLYGDLDVSIIDEMPKDRKPIITRVRHDSERDTVWEFVKDEIRKGRQAYIVYPLVEESEKVDLASAVESYEYLKNEVFSDCRVGLIHGKLFPYEKEDEMEFFRNGKTRILVGTTVIEVGVDVPNASVMVIEHAERFGLAQLHQLRGRVGRGAEQSYCFLIHEGKLSADAKERLVMMESSTDGFKISEKDAELRGAGNILGKEQSGTISDLKIANLAEDYPVLQSARAAAFAVIADDAHLRKPEHTIVREYYLKHYNERFGLADVG
jgi:ATP-dependent DNA helicase RecG